jgi:uncharacterized RDD family membrane protein YckC
MQDHEPLEYAGFWVRVGASFIDTVLLLMVTMPLLLYVYGWDYFDPERTGPFAGPFDFVVSWLLPAVAIVAFWIYRSATPGKMMLSLKVVDAGTGQPLRAGQAILRYAGYFVSTIPLCLGLIWVAFDPRKQGWHDKIAGTVVVRAARRGPLPVTFEKNQRG